MTAAMEVRELTVDFNAGRGRVFRAVDKVSFDLVSGETLALVGESGSGKSTVVRALGQLNKISGGQISLNGKPAAHRGRGLHEYRSDVQLVFQDPFASLNPSFSIRHHLARPLLLHGTPRSQVDSAIAELLEMVNLTPAADVAKKFPHELSGGQRQRVAIARALAPRPKVLLADEPVSMLDVSIRLGVLNLLDSMRRDLDLALLYVTHDLATARYFSKWIMVMYRGEVVEHGGADDVILRPAHPYTQMLAAAAPKSIASRRKLGLDLEAAANGTAQSASDASTAAPAARRSASSLIDRRDASVQGGCPFRLRCPRAMDICEQHPPDFTLPDERSVRCWLYAPDAPAAVVGAGVDGGPTS